MNPIQQEARDMEMSAARAPESPGEEFGGLRYPPGRRPSTQRRRLPPRTCCLAVALTTLGTCLFVAGCVASFGANGGSAAVEALRNLAYNNPANKVAIVAAGAVGPLVALVRAGDRTASWALEQLDVAALASRLQTPQGEKASRMRRLEAPECVVCLERARAVAFLPCGHFCVCSNCGQRLDECPICRNSTRKQRIYT